MRKFFPLLFLLLATKVYAQTNDRWLENAIKTSVAQLTLAAKNYLPPRNPRSVEPDGSVRLADPRDWTCGFFPGSLWYAYELSGKKQLAGKAKRFTLALDSVQYFTYTHDLGFMLYCSYGNAYRITKDPIFLAPLRQGAQSLYTRYNNNVKAIRSWDFGHWQFPIIIDNMMNLELLYWAAKQFHQPKYFEAAKNHAATTLKNHFRKNFSSYHVVSYDTINGKAVEKGTYQGLTHESSWARGQAWGLYGYVMSYLKTEDKKFLQQAKAIAAFITTHPSIPEDKIPLWDYDVPNAERGLKDASAAAVTASALLDISKILPGTQYFTYAEDILISLSSDYYLAKPGSNHFFVLKHSVGALLFNSEIDVPINYADYYYLEALIKYATIKNIDTKKFF